MQYVIFPLKRTLYSSQIILTSRIPHSFALDYLHPTTRFNRGVSVLIPGQKWPLYAVCWFRQRSTHRYRALVQLETDFDHERPSIPKVRIA